jgi:hypothetical protein
LHTYTRDLLPVCAGVKESDTGLAPPNLWDLQADKMMMQEEQPLQVPRPYHG